MYLTLTLGQDGNKFETTDPMMLIKHTFDDIKKNSLTLHSQPYSCDSDDSSLSADDRPWLAAASAAAAFSHGSPYTEESGNLHPYTSEHGYGEESISFYRYGILPEP